MGAAGERGGVGTRTRADAWQTYSRLVMRPVRYIHDIVVELYLVRGSYALVRSEVVMPQSTSKMARKLGVYVLTVAMDTGWLLQRRATRVATTAGVYPRRALYAYVQIPHRSYPSHG